MHERDGSDIADLKLRMATMSLVWFRCRKRTTTISVQIVSNIAYAADFSAPHSIQYQFILFFPLYYDSAKPIVIFNPCPNVPSAQPRQYSR